MLHPQVNQIRCEPGSSRDGFFCVAQRSIESIQLNNWHSTPFIFKLCVCCTHQELGFDLRDRELRTKQALSLIALIAGIGLYLFSGTALCAGLATDGVTGIEAAAFAATEQYMIQLDADQRLASDAYFEGKAWLILWNLFYGLLIAWGLMKSGLSVRMRNLGEKYTRIKYFQQCAYIVQYTLVVFILLIPLNMYEGFFREHQYNLSNQDFMGWFVEQGIGLMLELTLGSLLIAAIYVVIRRLPDSWAFWGSVTSVFFLVLIIMVSPVFIAPLFNEYKPLPESELKEQILMLARANGVPAEEVYQFDASEQSTRISANVSGLFGTTRISLNDNLINNISPEGVRAVMAHEIGHYALNHIIETLIYLSGIVIMAFFFIRFAFSRVIRPEWGVRDVSDIAGLPVVAALLSVFFTLMTLLNNTITRSNETEADIFALNAAREPDGFSEAVLSLSSYRKMKPGPVEEFILFDHPAGYQRIYRAMRWKLEQQSIVELEVPG